MARLLVAAAFGISSWLGTGMHHGLCQDVMFLMDTSQSMNDSDAIRTVPDAIRAMMASLEPSDRAGILTYSTWTTPVLPLTGVQPGQLPELSGVAYQGYTNTGDAMVQALAALEKSNEKQRSVVLVTDGEIMMPDSEGTLRSSQQFAECMERASRDGIPVYILTIKNGPDDWEYKLYGGYAKGETVPVGQIVMKSWELMRDELHTCGMELEVEKKLDASGRISSLTAKVPVPGAAHLQATVISSKPGRVAFGGQLPQKPERVQSQQLSTAQGDTLDLQADYPADAELKLVVVPTVDGVLNAEAESSRLGGGVTVRITPMGSESDGASLLSDASFHGKTVHLTLNGQETEGTVQDGVICAVLPKTDSDEILVEDVRFEELGFHFLGSNMARTSVPRPGILPWILAGLGIALLGFLLWLHRRKKEEPDEKKAPEIDFVPPPVPLEKEKPTSPPIIRTVAEKPEPEEEIEPESMQKGQETNRYRGKLAFYVTATPDGSDIQPMDYNLFRRSNGQEISLADLLKGCGVELRFPGAGDIIVGPLRHGIYLQNKSDCTIMKRGEILLKGRQVDLYYDEKVHIAFSDEKSELIMIYKSLKPNEK